MDNTAKKTKIELLGEREPWKITFLETGEETMTGGRVKQAEPFIGQEDCFLTYGDGIADIDIKKLYEFHKEKGRLATVTGIQKESQYGFINIQDNIAVSFSEKPRLDGIINGGFFVLSRRAFDYIEDSKNCIFERQPLINLAADRELAVYQHKGYWAAADTVKDLETIEQELKNKRPYWYAPKKYPISEIKE